MNRFAFSALAMVTLLGVSMLAACQTSAPGVKSNYRSQYTTVNATPQEAADAAADVLKGMDLRDVKKQATAVDGLVTAKTAQDTQIRVSIEKKSDTATEVSVNAGWMGDPDLGVKIISQIKDKLDNK